MNRLQNRPLSAIVQQVKNGRFRLILPLLLIVGLLFAGQKIWVAQAGDTQFLLLPIILTDGEPTGLSLNAVNDQYETAENESLAVNAANGLLKNDSIGDGVPVTITVVAGVSHGSLTIQNSGAFSYSPSANFSGTDSFTYRLNSSGQRSNNATVTLTVVADDAPPVANPDSYETPEDSTLSVNAANGVLSNDVYHGAGNLQTMLVSTPSNGTLNLAANGSFSYTPDANFAGQDSFSYRAKVGTAVSPPTTVTLSVSNVNDPPVAQADSYETAENSPLTIVAASGLLANDSDPDNDALTAMLITDASSGQLDLNDNGGFTYTPNVDFIGDDSFSYRANDGTLNSNSVTVVITVSPFNSPPLLVSGQVTFTKQTLATGLDATHAAFAADFDGDGDLDLTGTDYDEGLVLGFRQNSNGSFTEFTIDDDLEGAYPAHIGDVNLDGHIDVLAGGYDADAFAWYRNDGSGNFTRETIDAAIDGPHSIITIDLDQDDDVDLVTSSQDAGTVAWYENDGSEAFTRHVIDANALGAKRAEVGDLNGDNEIDVVAATYDGDELAWYENDGSENFTKHVITDQLKGGYYAVTAYVNDDDHLDIFAAARDNRHIWYFENDGAGNFTGVALEKRASGARTVIAEDVDSDGDIDAIATGTDINTIFWFENDGDGNFTTHIVDTASLGVYGLFTIDFNKDGLMDILTANRDAATIELLTQSKVHTETLSIGGSLLIDGAVLLTEDSDNTANELTYTVTALPSRGELQLDGVALGLNGTFTQADVNNGRLAYVHTAANGTPDEFSFTVSDGGALGVSPANGRFVIFFEA